MEIYISVFVQICLLIQTVNSYDSLNRSCRSNRHRNEGSSHPLKLHVSPRVVSLNIACKIHQIIKIFISTIILNEILYDDFWECFLQVKIDNGIVKLRLINPTGLIKGISYKDIPNVLENNFKESQRG